MGLTAYTLGLRHAFDADHIAAIDNTTRKLMADGQRPLSVGFFFSLGHSTIVFALAALFAVGVRALSGAVASDGSTLHQATGLIGPTRLGLVPVAIGVLNLAVLLGIVGVFRPMRVGDFDEQRLEAELIARGFMNRFLGRATSSVKQAVAHVSARPAVRPGVRHRDRDRAAVRPPAPPRRAGCPSTRSSACRSSSPPACRLLDTIDGAFMNFAYDWAFSKPVRKIFYNLTITGLSVAVALGIGTIELAQVFTDKVTVDLNYVGFVIVGLFAMTWVVAWAVWRIGRIEEKWTAGLNDART